MGDNAFTCGLVAGTTTSFIFNPIDRALFLSHLHKRPFLKRANFTSPFQGVNQVLLQRVISSGFLFPLEDALRRNLPTRSGCSSDVHNAVAGMTAGGVIAMVTNPLAIVTAQKWASRETGATTLSVAKTMFRKGGSKAFTRALPVTLARDVIWGGTFSLIRHGIPKLVTQNDRTPGIYYPSMLSFWSNVLAAGVATILSAPLNFCRNLQYGQCPGKAQKSSYEILAQLKKEANAAQLRSGESRTMYVAKRLALGWGTARVSIGIAFSSQIFSLAMTSL